MSIVIQHFTHHGKWEGSLGTAKETLWAGKRGWRAGMKDWDQHLGLAYNIGMQGWDAILGCNIGMQGWDLALE